MKIEIKEKKENALLKKQEIIFEATELKQTPSKKEIQGKIAALLNANENLVVIENIGQKFGSRVFEGKAAVYADKENMLKTSQKFLLKRNKLFEEKKPEEKKEVA